MALSETADECCTSGFHLCWSNAEWCVLLLLFKWESVCVWSQCVLNLVLTGGVEDVYGSIVSPLRAENLMVLLVPQAFIQELSDGSVALLCILKKVNCS